MTGFGALADGGLAWCEEDGVVELAGLGDVFAQPTLDALMRGGPPMWRDAIAAARSHDGPRTAPADARPKGILGPGEYGPARRLDIELELG